MLNVQKTIAGYDIHLSVTPSTAVDDMEPQFQQFGIESISETETSDTEFPHTGNAEFDESVQMYEDVKARYRYYLSELGFTHHATQKFYGLAMGLRYALLRWYPQVQPEVIV